MNDLLIEGSKATRSLTKQEISLLESWYKKIAVHNVAHDKASEYFMKLQKVLRTVMVTLPAIASYCGSNSTVAEHYNGKFIAMFLMVINATILAIESRLHCAERSETHHHATLKFRSLEMKIKALFAFDEVRSPGATISIIRKKYDEIISSSPVVPTRIFVNTQNSMTHHGLSSLGSPLPEARMMDEKKYFSNAELDMLQMRCAMAQSNRLYCIDLAATYQFRALVLGSAMGAVSVISTMLGALTFSDLPQSQKWSMCSSIGNACLTVLAVADGAGGYDEMTKKMHDFANRWSRLGREIDEVLLTQPHYSSGTLAVELEKKVSGFVNELKEQRLMEHFKHKSHADVQETQKQVRLSYQKAHGDFLDQLTDDTATPLLAEGKGP